MSWLLLFYLQLAQYQGLIITVFFLTVACVWYRFWLRFSHHPKPLDPRYVHPKLAHVFSYVFGISTLIMLSSYIGQAPVHPDSTWNLTWHRSRDSSNYAMDLWITKMQAHLVTDVVNGKAFHRLSRAEQQQFQQYHQQFQTIESAKQAYDDKTF